MKKPRKVIQPRWGVYRLGGKRAERMLFTVTAPNSDAAIERAIKENEIPERDRWRHVIEAERIFARQLQGIARLSIQGLDTRRPLATIALGYWTTLLLSDTNYVSTHK